MRIRTAAILIFVLLILISTLSIVTVLAASTFDTNTIRSTTIDLASLFNNVDPSMETDDINRAVEYAVSLGSNTIIAQGFVQDDVDTPTSKLLFPNTSVDLRPTPQSRLVHKLVQSAQSNGLRVAIALPILSYIPADTSSTYSLVRSTPGTDDFSVCSQPSSGCRLSPFGNTVKLLEQVLVELFTEVPSLDMVIFTQDTVSDTEDCSTVALTSYQTLFPQFKSCDDIANADESTLVQFGLVKARQISTIIDQAVQSLRANPVFSFTFNPLVGRYVYTSPFTSDNGVEYLSQSCDSIFIGVDLIFPLALPYFEETALPFGKNTIVQFDGYFKQVYDAFVRCDPTLLRIVPTLPTIDWSNKGDIKKAPIDFAQNEILLAASPTNIDPAEIYHWVDFLLTKLGFVHINLLDVDVIQQIPVLDNETAQWAELFKINNSYCINNPSDCSANLCVAAPLSPDKSCRNTGVNQCWGQPSLCPLTKNLCDTFPTRYGCLGDPCMNSPTSLGCSYMIISQIDDVETALTDKSIPYPLYPASSTITLQWDPRLLVGVPSPFNGFYSMIISIYLDYLSLGVTPTRILVFRTRNSPLSKQTTNLGTGEISITIPSSLLAGSDVSFRLDYGVPIATSTSKYFFISPTCLSNSIQIQDNTFNLSGSDQCQNGTKCNISTGKCGCEVLWPTYTATDFNDRCTRPASDFITCNNGGKASRGADGQGVWQCDCVNGFTGIYCDSSPDCSKAMVCYNQGFVIKDPVTKQCASKCTCQANWINSVCDTCSFRCLNGGRQNKGCTTCACAQGYSGTNCQCRQISFSMTLTSVPDSVLNDTTDSSNASDVFILNWFAEQLSTNVIQSDEMSQITSNNLIITTMTIDRTTKRNSLKIAGYVIDNCQELASNNNFPSIRDSWTTFINYLKDTPLDIDGTPYTPVDVATTPIDDKCDELYSNPAGDPTCALQPLVERTGAIGGPSQNNSSIIKTQNSIILATITVILALLL